MWKGYTLCESHHQNSEKESPVVSAKQGWGGMGRVRVKHAAHSRSENTAQFWNAGGASLYIFPS